eukprot:tig00000241_g20935.t1
MQPRRQVELFGGAMRCTVPAEYVDASDMREVPDNQEVFLDPSGDESVIIEIVELSADVPESDMARFHFGEIASVQGAALGEGAALLQTRQLAASDVPLVSAPLSASLAVGAMGLSKHRSNRDLTLVHVAVAVLRLPQVDSEILVTFNGGTKRAWPGAAAAAGEPGAEAAEAAARAALASLEVLDWSLFGHDMEAD